MEAGVELTTSCLATTSNTKDPFHSSIPCIIQMKTKGGTRPYTQTQASISLTLEEQAINISEAASSLYQWEPQTTTLPISASCNIRIKVPHKEAFKTITCRRLPAIMWRNRLIIKANTCRLTSLASNRSTRLLEMTIYPSITMLSPPRQHRLIINRQPLIWEGAAAV